MVRLIPPWSTITIYPLTIANKWDHPQHCLSVWSAGEINHTFHMPHRDTESRSVVGWPQQVQTRPLRCTTLCLASLNLADSASMLLYLLVIMTSKWSCSIHLRFGVVVRAWVSPATSRSSKSASTTSNPNTFSTFTACNFVVFIVSLFSFLLLASLFLLFLFSSLSFATDASMINL